MARWRKAFVYAWGTVYPIGRLVGVAAPHPRVLAGLNMLAVGLLGEMQVRHYHEPTSRAPYSVDRVLRAQSEESTISE